jgi:hypothetical protein
MGLYWGIVGVLGLPGVIVSSVGVALNNAGQYAMKDQQTFQYKQILHLLIEMLNAVNALSEDSSIFKVGLFSNPLLILACISYIFYKVHYFYTP